MMSGAGNSYKGNPQSHGNSALSSTRFNFAVPGYHVSLDHETDASSDYTNPIHKGSKAKASSNYTANNCERKNNEMSRKRKANALSDEHSKDPEPTYDESSKFKVEKISDQNSNETENEQKPPSRQHYWNPNVNGHVCGVIMKNVKGDDGNRLKLKDLKYFEIPKKEFELLAKSRIPERPISSDFEPGDSSPSVPEYEWEKLVDNEFIRRIDDNMKRTVDAYYLPEDEYKRISNEVMQDLKEIFWIEGNEHRWYCFGSYLYGIVDFATEINLVNEDLSVVESSGEILENFCKTISVSKKFLDVRMRNNCFEGKHVNTGKKFNISTYPREMDIQNSLLMKLYLGMNPILRYLVGYIRLIFNKYCRRMNLKNVTPFVRFWLIVFFMQQKVLLPSVFHVRKSAEIHRDVSGWDCSLPEEYYCLTERVSLYALLLGFFDFYKHFDYWNNVISPHFGRVVNINDLERLRVPAEEFSVYLRKAQNPDQPSFTRGFLNLQDPTNLCLNLGRTNCNLNHFKVICHRLSEVLSKNMAEIQQIDCFCHALPDLINVNAYSPCNFTKYGKLLQNRQSMIIDSVISLDKDLVLLGIRKLMEKVFRLNLKSIVVQDFSYTFYDREKECISKVTYPILYFEYFSTNKFWKNTFMKQIVARGDGIEEESIFIRLRCEIHYHDKLVRVFCGSNARFIGYLQQNFIEMLRNVMAGLKVPSSSAS